MTHKSDKPFFSGQICIVHWIDAAGLQTTQKEWLTIEEAKEIAELKWKNLNISNGFVIYEDRRYLIVAGSRADDSIYSDMSMIPKSLIVKIEKFPRKKRKKVQTLNQKD